MVMQYSSTLVLARFIQRWHQQMDHAQMNATYSVVVPTDLIHHISLIPRLYYDEDMNYYALIVMQDL